MTTIIDHNRLFPSSRNYLNFLALVLLVLFSDNSVQAQNFLEQLKAVDSNTKNYQSDPQRIKFIKTEFNNFTIQNFLALYNHSYDKEYDVRMWEGEDVIVDKLLNNETSAEYKEYVKVKNGLEDISKQRNRVLSPLNSAIVNQLVDIRNCVGIIRAFREDAEHIIMKEKEEKRKDINRANTLNFISSFLGGLSGSSENVVYQVPSSSVLYWTLGYDFSNKGLAVSPEMRKRHNFKEVSSEAMIKNINDFIERLLEWIDLLETQEATYRKEYEKNETYWNGVQSNYISNNFGSNKNQLHFLEAALEKKYGDWYNSEIQQIRDLYNRKFGEAGTDLNFVWEFTFFANAVRDYYNDMKNYSVYNKDQKITGISYKTISDRYKKINTSAYLSSSNFVRVVESMQEFMSYVDNKSELYSMFKAYSEGKKSKYYYEVREFIQPYSNSPTKTIESVISDLATLDEPTFEDLTYGVSFMFKGFEYEKIRIITDDLKDNFYGLSNIQAKQVTLVFKDKQLDAMDFSVFDEMVGLTQLIINCDCKVKNLKQFQSSAKYNIVTVTK